MSARALIPVACLVLVLSACGLENKPGALGGAAPAAENTKVMVAPASASASSDPDWGAFNLTSQVIAWLPTTPQWELTEQGTTAGGARYFRVLNSAAELSVLVQAPVVDAGIAAATICAQVAQGALAEVGAAEIEPVPLGNPAPHALALDVFSCAATGIPGPDGSVDYRVDVVLRPADQSCYLQIVHLGSAGDAQAQRAASQIVDEMLRRSVASLLA